MRLILVLAAVTVFASGCKNPLEKSGVTYNQNADVNKATIKLDPEANPEQITTPIQEDLTSVDLQKNIPLWNCSVFENERHSESCLEIKKTIQKDFLWEQNGFAVSCSTLPTELTANCEQLARDFFKNVTAFDCEKNLKSPYNSNKETEEVRCELIQSSYGQGQLIKDLKENGALVKPGEKEIRFQEIQESRRQVQDSTSPTDLNDISMDTTPVEAINHAVEPDAAVEENVEPTTETEETTTTTTTTEVAEATRSIEATAEEFKPISMEEAARQLGVKKIPKPEPRPEWTQEQRAKQLGYKTVPKPKKRPVVKKK